MPTLIRLFILLVILAGLVFGGMVALTLFVDPGEKDITVKIPARELQPPADDGSIDVNDLPAPVNIASDEPSEVLLEESLTSEPSDDADVSTLEVEPGAPE